MHAVKVDQTKRIRLKVLRPGDLYVPEYATAEVITLRRIEPPRPRPKGSFLAALKVLGSFPVAPRNQARVAAPAHDA